MIDDLVAFWTARLDEDEAAARESYYEGQRWLTEEEGVYRWPDDELIHSADRKADARHIALHDPGRSLREVAAARTRLSELIRRPHDWNAADEFYSCSQAVSQGSAEPGSGCGDPDRRGDPCDCGRDAFVERMLRIEVSVWADHPDYQQEVWRPQLLTAGS